MTRLRHVLGRTPSGSCGRSMYSRLSISSQQRVGARGLLLVHRADREADVDHDPVPELDLGRVLEAGLAPDPAEVDGAHADPVLVEDLDHLAGNAEAHR